MITDGQKPETSTPAKGRTHRKVRDVCATRETTPHPAARAATLSPRRGLDLESSTRGGRGRKAKPGGGDIAATGPADIAQQVTSAPPNESRTHRKVRDVCATHDEIQKPRAELVGTPVRLLPYQRRWVEDRSPLKMVVKARQIGYSFSATLQALLRCLERKTTWIFLSKGERQSKLLMEKVQEHVQSCGIVAQAFESTFFEGTSQKQLEVRFPNGSVIYGLPSNPDTARGYSGNVTLDEFAFHADAAKIYSALFPSITRGYCLEVISTPNGQQGKFYELAKSAGLVDAEIGSRKWEVGKEALVSTIPYSPLPTSCSRSWSPHWCDVYEAVRQGLKINIELLRAGCDDETTFQQEFCCQFISTAENFFPPDLLAACLSAEASTDTPAHHLASARGVERQGVANRKWEVSQIPSSLPTSYFPLPIADFFLGIDIGRQHDRTVFWLDEVQVADAGGGTAGAGIAPAPAEERLAIARIVRTLDRAPFAEQLECARELLRLERNDGTPLVRRAAIDATGIGAMLAETLAEEFGPRVEPVTFTAAVKENLAFRTKRLMEKQLSLLPDTREVRRAFSAVKKFVTPSGNLRFDAARTAAGHADEFWAKTLADLAAESEPEAAAADGYLAGGAPVINPRAFRELDGELELFG